MNVVKDPRPGLWAHILGSGFSGMQGSDVRAVGAPKKQLLLICLLSSYHRCEFKIPLAVKKGECSSVHKVKGVELLSCVKKGEKPAECSGQPG